MPLDAAAILERVDRALAELRAIRDELAAAMPVTNGADAASDFAEHQLIDVPSAQIRFSILEDTLRKWARETEGTPDAVGIRCGGRWQLSIPRLRRRCGCG